MSDFKALHWFNKLFGFDEKLESVAQHIKLEKIGENYKLKSDLNNISYNAGNFQVRYISSFIDSPEKRPIRNGGKLNILVGDGYNTLSFEKIDSLSMQSLPVNDGATYLVASNFNCLEFTSPMQTPCDGVTNYVNDHTQGPYSALACPQCAVLRNYFVEFQNEEGEIEIGQINTQINLLSKTPISVENGYAIINNEDSDNLAKYDFNWADENNYAVGVHSNCEVIMTRAGGNRFKFVGRIDKKLCKKKHNRENHSMKKHHIKKQNEDYSCIENNSTEKDFIENHCTENNNIEKHGTKKVDQFEENVIQNDDKDRKHSKHDVKKHIISNHVYAAALNFRGDVIQNDFTIEIASNILKAEYKAAVLAAWENSVKMEEEGRAAAQVLYLTLLGGGVFGNPIELIAESIVSCKDVIVESGLNVWVVCFNQDSFSMIKDILMPVVVETGGLIDYLADDNDC